MVQLCLDLWYLAILWIPINTTEKQSINTRISLLVVMVVMLLELLDGEKKQKMGNLLNIGGLLIRGELHGDLMDILNLKEKWLNVN